MDIKLINIGFVLFPTWYLHRMILRRHYGITC